MTQTQSTSKYVTPSTIALGQGAFWFAAGIWPVLHLRSFKWVTGPKPEGWLVKTIGSLIATVGVCLGAAGANMRVTPETRFLGVASALVLGGADVIYASKRRISPIYLADAVVQAATLVGWWQAQKRQKALAVPA
jgi:hypothetical protein